MACGVPCVATDVGDSAHILGATGLIVPPRDPEALANAWLALLGQGEAKRRALGLEARKRILTHFSLPAITQRYQALWTQHLRRLP
jgi:glycosyltransferase involved in cell wall biosynthesis